MLTWHQICQITSLFSNLKILDVSDNKLAQLHFCTLPYCVTEVKLENNLFETISDLGALTALPNLKRLILRSNKISVIWPKGQTSSDTPKFSKNLLELDVSYNCIDNWRFIDQLKLVFPGMTSLRIANNPLYEDLRSPVGKALKADDGYMLTIARLGQLKVLNFSPVS